MAEKVNPLVSFLRKRRVDAVGRAVQQCVAPLLGSEDYSFRDTDTSYIRGGRNLGNRGWTMLEAGHDQEDIHYHASIAFDNGKVTDVQVKRERMRDSAFGWKIAEETTYPVFLDKRRGLTREQAQLVKSVFAGASLSLRRDKLAKN